jgi:cap2 methyltransferase
MSEDNRFILPRVKEICLKVRKGNRKDQISFLLPKNKLEETKNKLSSINQNTWIKARKIINNYEFPFSQEKLKLKPISRAFFKMLEIIKDNDVNITTNTLHLAEAPGGFIEAVLYYKQKLKIKNTKHYTFSIIGNKKTPIYHRRIVANKDVFILSNKENKGDLYLPKNISYIINEMTNKHINFITCDGGFTENNEFSEKEQLHHKLIFNQIICSLFVLEEGGSFVIKIFDIFTELTFDMLYILSYLFKEIYIHKPLTSRNTNSEKYICCKFFSKWLFDDKVQNVLKYLYANDIENYKSFIDKSTINKEFLQRIIDINNILSNKQIESINNILDGTKDTASNVSGWINRYY